MEYPPPSTLVYSGIQFNPALFEIDAVDNVFGQATIATLNTDNIQGIAPANTISLYTLSTGFINLGSNLLNTITTRAADFAMYGNLSIRNFAGNQVIGYTLHLANIVAQVFYADSTTPTISANLSITPNTVGDVVSGNGNFVVNSGEARFVSLRLSKFQAPFHYFYDAAALIYRRFSYGASQCIEILYCDPANITVGSTAILVSPDTLTPTTAYRGIYEVRTGKIDLNANTSITAGAPIIPSYPYNSTFGSGLVGGTTSIGQAATLSLNVPVVLTSSSVISLVGKFTSCTAGVYMLYYYVDFACTVSASTITRISMFVGSGQSVIPPITFNNIVKNNKVCGNLTLTNGRTTGFSLCVPIILTATSNVFCNFGIDFTGGTISTSGCTTDTCSLFRIA